MEDKNFTLERIAGNSVEGDLKQLILLPLFYFLLRVLNNHF